VPNGFLPPHSTLTLFIMVQGSTLRLQSGQSCVLGRDPECDIVLTDRRVSWRHAVVRLTQDGWVFEDAGSINGTFLDGSRIDIGRISSSSVFRLADAEDGPLVHCWVICPGPGGIDVPAPRTAGLSADRRDPGLAVSCRAEPRDPGDGRHQIRLAGQENDTPAKTFAEHNEGETVEALLDQTRKPDEVDVFTDNCTDDGAMTTAHARPRPGADGQPPGRTAAEAPTRFIVRPVITRAVPQRVVALIPAYNGAAGIAATIRCLQAQTRPPDRIVVAANNCTDNTADEARRAGADVWETHRETRVKADALNSALEHVLPHLADNALVMIMDDDTAITPGFIEEAIARFEAGPGVGGLSAVYSGRPGRSWAVWCQRNEFARWGFDARQRRGDGRLAKAICLSGACSILRVQALRDVIAARRDGRIGGGDGPRPVVYREDNQTEDFELSVALMHCGWKIRNMLRAGIQTAVKPTWTELHIQRLRWNGGITETLLQYGWTRHTRAMWVRWVIYALSVASIPLSLFLVAERLASGAGFHLNAWMFLWLAVTAVMSVHKTVTIFRTRGAVASMLAFMLVAELPYDLFLHATWVRSLWLHARNAEKHWGRNP
jgi:cellulose synthase/poly-beta-1,6-N-acetylglucosamine synthase-like glycosyltransferase